MTQIKNSLKTQLTDEHLENQKTTMLKPDFKTLSQKKQTQRNDLLKSKYIPKGNITKFPILGVYKLDLKKNYYSFTLKKSYLSKISGDVIFPIFIHLSFFFFLTLLLNYLVASV